MEKKEVREAWDEISEEYARKRDASGSDAALIDGLLEKLGEEARVLDIGCGDGARTLANLPEGVV
jgi:cyclopropane fatty-acyl-phospholipid synthase-like methyltransferase